MDEEITALEKRRAKTQAIKQGMMQELLTGKTRLIDNSQWSTVNSRKPRRLILENLKLLRGTPPVQ